MLALLVGPRSKQFLTLLILLSFGLTTQAKAQEAAPRPYPPPIPTQNYVLGLGLLSSAIASNWFIETPPRGWKNDLPLDPQVRDLLRLDSLDHRETVSTVSDILQNTLLAAPLLIDVLGVSLLYHQDPEMAWRMAYIDMEAAALSTAVVMLTKRAIGRVRPGYAPCTPGSNDYSCHSNAARASFISGHTSAAFTAAGLLCLHHSQLDLFGGGTADQLFCASALALAGSTGIMRIMAHRHYFSDVLAGTALGLSAGFLFPYMMYYAPKELSMNSSLEVDSFIGYGLGALNYRGQSELSVGAQLQLSVSGQLSESWRLRTQLEGELSRGVEEGPFAQGSLGLSTGLNYGYLYLGWSGRYRSFDSPTDSYTQLTSGGRLAFIKPGDALSLRVALDYQPLGETEADNLALKIHAGFFEKFEAQIDLAHWRGPQQESAWLAQLSLGAFLQW